MPKTRGTGLLMLWMDVDAELEPEFNRWYNEEHIPNLVKTPGFLNGGRYLALTGGPKYMVMYELEDHNVLRSAAFLNDMRYRPTPWRQKISGGHIGRNYIINSYRQVYPARTNPIDNTGPMAPYLRVSRFDVSRNYAEEVADWHDLALAPALLTVPGVSNVRRYEVIESQPNYLTVVELDRPERGDSAEWVAARDGNPWTTRTRPHLRFDAGSPGLYQRLFPDPV